MKKTIYQQKINPSSFHSIVGFTLIELIVAVTAIMVLTGVGAMSLNNFKGVKELESAREEISGYIKLARNLALTKQLSTEASNLKYVRVIISGNNLTIIGIDSDNNQDTSPPYSSINIDTKNEILISTSNFGFMASTGRLTDSNGNLIETTMTVDISRGLDKKTIIINDLGIINNAN